MKPSNWQVDCMWCHSKQCSSKCDMCYWVSNCVCLRTKVLWCLAVRQRRQHKSAYQITYVHSDWMLPFGLSLAWLTLQQHVGEFSGCILFVWLWFLLHGWIFTACDIGAVFSWVSVRSLSYTASHREGSNKRCFCLSVHLSVRLSVAYIANNSRTQRPSVHISGRKVAHLRCDSHTSFSVSQTSGRSGWGTGGQTQWPHCFFVRFD